MTTSSKNSQILQAQLTEFLTLQEKRCDAHFISPREKELVHNYFGWAAEFIQEYMQSREQRAIESVSAPVVSARDIARVYIGEKNHDFFATCIDGRTMPLVMFSRPPHIGGVLRAPAGILQGFMRGTKPTTVFIDESSPIISRLKKLLLSKPNETIFYGFDSHYGCAARQQIHDRRGGHEEDGGLRSDVMSKLMMAQGLLELREQLVAAGHTPATVIPTFFSFNPHTGFISAGLEMHVDDPVVAAKGYTSEVIEQMTIENKLIGTQTLIQEPEILKALSEALQEKSADFRKDFPASLLRNWQAIHHLYAEGSGKMFTLIYTKLEQIYKNSGWNTFGTDNIREKCVSANTLKQKAKFLLKNIVTRYSIAGLDAEWPYHGHQEDLVVITEGGYAPFPALDAFAVFSQDLDALLPNTQLAIELIRSSRAKKLVTDPTHRFETTQEFKSAPVFVSNKAILRSGDSQTWENFQNIRFSESFAQINWDSEEVLGWDRADILACLNRISNITTVTVDLPFASALVDAIYELFHRMRLMMKNKVFREMILRGEIIVLHTIVDKNRLPRLIIPIVV